MEAIMPFRAYLSAALALFSGPGPCVVLGVSVIVTGIVAAYAIKRIADTRPTIEVVPGKGIKLTFPSDSPVK